MSDGNIVNDWIDADKLRQTAEDLLVPADQLEKDAKEAATYGEDFVGFAEVGKEGVKSRSQEVARESLSKAKETATEAEIISPPRKDPFPPAPVSKPKPVSAPQAMKAPESLKTDPVSTPPVLSKVTLPPKVVSSSEVVPPPEVTSATVKPPAAVPVKPTPITKESVRPVLVRPKRITREDVKYSVKKSVPPVSMVNTQRVSL